MNEDSEKLIEVVAAIIKVNKYRQRKKNKLTYLSEKYEFPGGKIEKNGKRCLIQLWRI